MSLLKGLPNLTGSTCYLNSILQILIHTPEFISSLREHPADASIEGYNIAESLLKVFDSYFQQGANMTKPLTEFIRAFMTYYDKFGMGQQDQNEYLMLLFRIIHDTCHDEVQFNLTGSASNELDQLEEKSLRSLRVDGMSTTFDSLKEGDERRAYSSSIFQLFTGQFHFRTECREPECRYISHRFEPFRSIELPMANPDKRSLTLDDCLRSYSGITQLGKDDVYECDKCHVKTRSLLRCCIWRPPNILVITLKRFIWYMNNGQLCTLKDSRPVEAPDVLDLTPYMSAPRGPCRYELYATANHMGQPEFGHCKSFVKLNGKWYTADDERVQAANQGLDTQGQYILFYKLIRN